MKKIFITATNTDIGKTYTTCKLIESYAKNSLRVDALKPIETGVKTLPPDGEKLAQTLKRFYPEDAPSVSEIVPFTFKQPAAPYIAAGNEQIDPDTLLHVVRQHQRECDVLLIEGAGGLYVPITQTYFMIDLIKDLDVDAVLLVSHCSLGCINDTLLSLKALQNYNLPTLCVFNCKEGMEDFEKTSKPFFDAAFLEVLHVDKDIDKIAKLLYNL